MAKAGPYGAKGVVSMMQQKCMQEENTLITMIKNYENLS